LTPFRQGGDDLAHIVDESHVEHAVRLIEHEDLDRSHVDGVSPHVIHESARGRHDDVDPAAQGGQLPVDVHAAIDGQRSHVEEPAVVVDRLLDLYGQFSRRREDQGPDNSFSGGPCGVKSTQDGQHECRRLACPGLGAADDVPEVEGRRNRMRLDLRGSCVAAGQYAAQQRVG